MRSIFVCSLSLILFSTDLHSQSPDKNIPRKAVESENGMVVCVSPIAADVGVDILKKGGNAVDAAVAVAFTMAVTWPEAGNIGGGGFMHIWTGEKNTPSVIDYREMAPAKSTSTMFIDRKADAFSHLSAGTPGTVKGLSMAHEKYGKLPWKILLEPAVKLATEGFTVNAGLAKRINGIMADSHQPKNQEFVRVYGKNGKQNEEWLPGDQLTLPDLGNTLARIRDQGADGFYKGKTATLIENEMQLGLGIMTASDLADYKAIQRDSIHTTYRGHDVYAAPLPSGGGVILIETLNILEQFELNKHDRFSAETVHLISEANRRSFADRAKYMGDPAFIKTDVSFLTTKEHAKKRAATINLKSTTLSQDLEDSVPLSELKQFKEGDSTTHFSVVDQAGMAVSNTYTLENSFGSQIVVRGAGFILNNEMTDFNIRPGITNQSGTVGTLPNQIEPGKRMLSSQCPIFISKNGKLLLITGSPGGRTIPNTVLNVAINVVDFGMEIQQAVDAPRHHHQWFPDRIQFEQTDANKELVEKLRQMGHNVSKSRQGDAHSIYINPMNKKYYGAADSRLDGKAAGY